MNEIQILAAVLLLGRFIAISFITSVLLKQLKLFKLYIPDHVRIFRRILFFLALALFASNFIPMVIDLLALTLVASKSSGLPSLIGLVYTLSNMTTSVISALFAWLLYREAARVSANKL